ncbi:MAG: ISKra4 family transposase, partial [Alphaproteobacteria bacterium]|nr:ISKra4 family transposase [Alphaproteobacteria bacterium]
QGSYDAAVQNLRRTSGAMIAKRQVEELAVGVSRDFESFYLERAREPEDPQRLMVLTFDGAGVVMRPEDLREQTRKKAAKAHRKRTIAESVAQETSGAARQHRKRMAEVAAVYSLEPVSRTPEDVTRELRRTGPSPDRPKAQNKRVWASVEHSIVDVVDEAFAEASLRDETNARRWVSLVDGNEEQLFSVQRMARNYEVTVTIVIDFIHVLGKLWEAGRALLGQTVPVGNVEAWVDVRAERILRGQSSLVAAGMTRSATCRQLQGRARKAVDACARYLVKHSSRLRYHEYLRDGLPIATGVIEGACRSLVKDRMDITGARWGLQGAEAVLKLRALRASGDLDAYLAFHRHQELARNHLSRFHDTELTDLRAAA